MAVLVYFLFFAENMGRSSTTNYSYNLVPFREIRRFIRYRKILGTDVVLMNLLGNVAAFVPFGLFIRPVTAGRLSYFEAGLITFDMSLAVEFIQLVTRVGSFDVDDLLLNTLGGIAGLFIYAVIKKIERKHFNGKTQI